MTCQNDRIGDRAAVSGGLRALADYLDQHPGLPAEDWQVSVYPAVGLAEDLRRAAVDRIAAELGAPVADDTADGGHYEAARRFGPVTYRAICVSDRLRAEHRALMSYSGAVTPAPAQAA